MANTATQEEATPDKDAATTQLIELAIKDPDAIDIETVERMVSSTNISEEQREVFSTLGETKKAIEAVRDLEKSTAGVNSDILRGGDGFKGVSQYLADASRNIQADDQAAVQEDLNNLRSFYTHQAAKRQSIVQAQESLEGQERGTRYSYRDANGNWGVAQQKPWANEDERRAMSGTAVHASKAGRTATSARLDLMQAEISAITAAGKQISAMLKAGTNLASKVESPTKQGGLDSSDVGPETKKPTPEEKKVIAKQKRQQRGTAETEQSSGPDLGTVEGTSETSTSVQQESEVDTETTPNIDDELRAAFENLKAQADERKVQTGGYEGLQVLDSEKDPSNVAAEDFRSTNLLGRYFRQPNNGSPLVNVGDFFNRLFEGGTLNREVLARYLPNSETLNQEQINSFLAFAGFHNLVAETITENMRNAFYSSRESSKQKKAVYNERDPDFWFKDFVQFTRGENPTNRSDNQEDLEVDPNMVTAIALAAFTWVSDNGTQMNSDRDINRILGRDDTTDITPEDEVLRFIGSRKALVVSDMGKNVAKMLNTKLIKGAPKNHRTQWELSLGMQALAVLQQKGFAVQTDINLTGEQKVDAAGNAHDVTSGFIKVRQDENHEPIG